jgi:hypothetical protein
MPLNLSSIVKITKVKDHTTAGTTDVESDIIDMQGYEGVMFLTSLGTAAADNLIKVQQNTANSTSGMADLTGTGVTSGASPSNEDLWVDVYRPRERYLRAVVVIDTPSTCESVWAFQYGARETPVDNTTSGTITGESWASPAEGTA